ncbi:MAG: hypothetical protein ABGY95_09540 [Rubritalea sp.]|uniref:hypothetical protein n=1 Tax=Rubritalea sp. TaxID=2109375 RepID=UPI0032429788
MSQTLYQALIKFRNTLPLLLLFFFCALPAESLGAVIDGQWNGKPWSQEKMAAGLKTNGSDALAECAYCSKHGKNHCKYDIQKIYERSKLAGEKGSTLGKTVHASCLYDQRKIPENRALAITLLKEASKEHPLGIIGLAIENYQQDFFKDKCMKAYHNILPLKEQDVIFVYTIESAFKGYSALPIFDSKKRSNLESRH